MGFIQHEVLIVTTYGFEPYGHGREFESAVNGLRAEMAEALRGRTRER